MLCFAVLYVNRCGICSKNARRKAVEVLCFAGGIGGSIEEEGSSFRYHGGCTSSPVERDQFLAGRNCGVGFILYKFRSKRAGCVAFV